MLEAGRQYRGKLVDGPVIKQNEKGTRSIEGVLEVTLGPELGRRIRYRGYVNSPKNAETTIEELRALGWRGQAFGDWSGIGSREVEFTAMVDQAGERKYWRAAFVRAPMTLTDKGVARPDDVDELNRQFGGMLRSATTNGAPAAPPPGRFDDDDGVPFDDADAGP